MLPLEQISQTHDDRIQRRVSTTKKVNLGSTTAEQRVGGKGKKEKYCDEKSARRMSD
jgi:hypothetical protein